MLPDGGSGRRTLRRDPVEERRDLYAEHNRVHGVGLRRPAARHRRTAGCGLLRHSRALTGKTQLRDVERLDAQPSFFDSVKARFSSSARPAVDSKAEAQSSKRIAAAAKAAKGACERNKPVDPSTLSEPVRSATAQVLLSRSLERNVLVMMPKFDLASMESAQQAAYVSAFATVGREVIAKEFEQRLAYFRRAA